MVEFFMLFWCRELCAFLNTLQSVAVNDLSENRMLSAITIIGNRVQLQWDFGDCY